MWGTFADIHQLPAGATHRRAPVRWGNYLESAMAKNALISIVEDDQLFRESMRKNTDSPETDQYHLPPSGVGHASSKSRNGRWASSVSRCLRQAWSYYVVWGAADRVFCRAWRVGDDGRPLCWSFCLSLTTRRPQACERLAHEREGS